MIRNVVLTIRHPMHKIVFSKQEDEANNQVLKDRIKKLENQVSEYSRRLDELRRAKNTVVIKKEKLSIDNSPDKRLCGLQGQLAEEEENKCKHELHKLQNTCTQRTSSNDINMSYIDEISTLKKALAEANDEKMALFMENMELRELIISLEEQLSVKEAKWCTNEEDLKIKLKMQWGEKYAEWIASTEQKVERLDMVHQDQIGATGPKQD